MRFRSARDPVQLDLFAAAPRSLDAHELLCELHARGAGRIRAVRLRSNRSRLLSLSRDGYTLNAHECFALAPPQVLDAVASFVVAEKGTSDLRDAVRRVRAWPGACNGLEPAHRAAADTSRTARCCGTPEQALFLRGLYEHLNRTRFHARLPAALPLRLSDRMSNRFGHVSFLRSEAGARSVLELALNVQLLAPGNDGLLLDTMLHEMAHVEAWQRYGHRKHGATWKRICLRVGCIPRACTPLRMRRLRGPVLRVPRLALAASTGNGRPPANGA